MKLKEANQNFFSRYHALLMPLLLALLSYLGIDGYGKVQEYRSESVPSVDVTINTPTEHDEKDWTPVINQAINKSDRLHLEKQHGY